MKLVEKLKDAAGTELMQKITTFGYDNNGNEQRRSVEYITLYSKANPKAYEAAVYNEDTTELIHAVVEQTVNKYDGFNRLVKTELIKATVQTIVEYIYDGDGLRTQKTVRRSDKGNTAEVTSYLYDRQHVILETRASEEIRYVRGINYIARVDSTDKLSYYLYNGHGDVVQTVSEAGEIENQYDYDIFGNPTLTVENYQNSIRYAGEFYDSETGLYYLRARYYDPYIGRFISEDSYWGEDANPLSLNLYTYCENDPIRYIDPTGHLPMVDDDTVYNPHTGNVTNRRTGERKSLRDYDRDKREEQRRKEAEEEQKRERIRIENKLKEFRAALEKAMQAKEKSMADALKQQLEALETDIEKYSQIDGIGAEELKSLIIPELNSTLSKETKGYNVYVDLMQYKLNKLGYTDANGNRLAEDGKFGKNTEYAVNKFKETNKLWNDNQYRGKVGETSFDLLFSGKAKRAPEEEGRKGGQSEGSDPRTDNSYTKYTARNQAPGTNTYEKTDYPGGTIGLSPSVPQGTGNDVIPTISPSKVPVAAATTIAIPLTKDFGTAVINAAKGIKISPQGVVISAAAAYLFEPIVLSEGDLETPIQNKNKSGEPAIDNFPDTFPDNPADFNPPGLERKEYKDGDIIKWKDPATGDSVYEWNKDNKYGDHYHYTPDGKNRVPHPDTGDTHINPGQNVPIK